MKDLKNKILCPQKQFKPFFTTNIEQMLIRYAEGERVADIASEFSISVSKMYSNFRAFPKKYHEAKKERAIKRNAKYRKAGELAIDRQIAYLEGIDPNDKIVLSTEIGNILKVGENAERRADLNEGKATDRTAIEGPGFIIELPEKFKPKNIKSFTGGKNEI